MGGLLLQNLLKKGRLSVREKLSIAICDDTAADRKIISSYILNYLDQHGYVADLTEYDSGEKLLESDVSSYNLIVLDIFFGGAALGSRPPESWSRLPRILGSSFAVRPMSLQQSPMMWQPCAI